MKISAFLFLFLLFCVSGNAQPVWQANLDGTVRFYQTTDFGIVAAGSENSLFAFDGQTGEKLWQRKTKGLDETSVTPIPATDLILVSTDEGDKSRIEAVDLLSGDSLWRTEKVKGDVMQLAVEPAQDLLAVVLVKKAKGIVGKEFKRTPIVHVFRLSDGDELWKKELESDVQMMPSRFDSDGEVPYTLDNYRAPLMIDGKLLLFYEGVTSYDAVTGKEITREKFKVNEGGLALTEADPVLDEKFIYTSGRGKIRAVNRQTSKVEWEADDLGVTPETAVVGNILYVRTGGQFTRIKDGETEEKGAFGVSAIDTRSGKILWRYKGADKGLTNFVFADENTILVADRDDLITLDAQNGKRISKQKHDVERARFVLVNERREAVVGGQDEIAAFQVSRPKFQDSSQTRFSTVAFSKRQFGDKLSGENKNQYRLETWDLGLESQAVWRVKHKAPSRGVLRTVAGVALRAAALYFRYGGLATSALNLVRGASLARSVLSLRRSGLRNNFSSLNLTSLAANSAQNYISNRISIFGISRNNVQFINRMRGLAQIDIPRAADIRGRIINNAAKSVTPSRADVGQSLLDRIDPARQAERLSDYFLRRKKLAELRGNYMYFYTDLPKPFDRKGLIGVNIHTGQNARFILVSDPDARFTTDETVGLLYSANGSKLQAFDFLNR